MLFLVIFSLSQFQSYFVYLFKYYSFFCYFRLCKIDIMVNVCSPILQYAGVSYGETVLSNMVVLLARVEVGCHVVADMLIEISFYLIRFFTS